MPIQPTSSRTRRLPRRAPAIVSGALVAGLLAAAPPAAAVDVVRVDSRDHPAALVGSGTLGQSFTVDSAEVTRVGGMFATYSTSDSGFTLTLRADGPAGVVVVAETIANANDNSWVELDVATPLPPGRYYLEAGAVVGQIAWWSNEPDVYGGGTAFADGAATSGDRTLVLANDEIDPVDPPVDVPGFVGGVAEGMTFTPGGITLRRDDGSGFSYDYAPSVIVEDGRERMWWCGSNSGGDGVYYAERPVGGEEWSEPVVVVAADQEWEVVHACDPSVVTGRFRAGGETYRYAMYYGAADATGQNTKIGAAYSHDGIEWDKHDDGPILADRQQVYDYGLGMPASFTGRDGTWLTYFDSGRNSSTVVRRMAPSGRPSPSSYLLPFSSMDTFADLAFSRREGVWYLATKSQLPDHGDEETYVFRSLGADLETTQWAYVGVVGEWLTGFPRNHNAGWYRDDQGYLYEPGGVKTLVFGAQDGLPGATDPSLWELGVVTITGRPTADSGPGGFELTGPADGATIDALDIDDFAWSESPGATSYTLTVSTEPSLSPERAALRTTVHPASFQGVLEEFTSGPQTQRMALEPATTYYWSVTAVNPDGSAGATGGPFVLHTSPDYRLDLTGGYVGWSAAGGAQFTPGEPATLVLPDATATLKAGGDYTPLRVELGGLNSLVVGLADGTTVTDLVIGYKLQSDPYSDPWRTVTAGVIPGQRELVVDMAGKPGWGRGDERLAWLRVGSSTGGTVVLDGLTLR